MAVEQLKARRYDNDPGVKAALWMQPALFVGVVALHFAPPVVNAGLDAVQKDRVIHVPASAMQVEPKHNGRLAFNVPKNQVDQIDCGAKNFAFEHDRPHSKTILPTDLNDHYVSVECGDVTLGLQGQYTVIQNDKIHHGYSMPNSTISSCAIECNITPKLHFPANPLQDYAEYFLQA